MRVILRGRRNIWRAWRVIPVGPYFTHEHFVLQGVILCSTEYYWSSTL